MVRVESGILQKNMIYKGEIVLKYRIEYPIIRGFEEFNLYNFNKAIELQKRCEEELFNDAKSTFDYDKQNEYPVILYEILSNYRITYNMNDIVSLYIDEYVFTVGAHGNTIRTSQTWNTQERRMVSMQEFFKHEPNYVSRIIKNINEQIENNIKNGNNFYFENYCCLTSANFKVENYYIKNGKFIIYYQQYDIAPYLSGILVFEM